MAGWLVTVVSDCADTVQLRRCKGAPQPGLGSQRCRETTTKANIAGKAWQRSSLTAATRATLYSLQHPVQPAACSTMSNCPGRRHRKLTYATNRLPKADQLPAAQSTAACSTIRIDAVGYERGDNDNRGPSPLRISMHHSAFPCVASSATVNT